MTNQLRFRPSLLTRTRAGLTLAILFLSLLSFVLPAMRRSQAANKRQTLTFEERVTYQRALEEVYWRHRLWPKDNPQPKPSLDEVMPEAAIRAKVADYLRQSSALETYWQQPITAEQLQAEITRLAQHTQRPEVLREMWAALGNDPFIIAECLARPLLAERLSRSLYASDDRWHSELKRRAEAELSRLDTAAHIKQMSGEYRETIWLKAAHAAEARHHSEPPSTFIVDPAQWPEQVQQLSARAHNTFIVAPAQWSGHVQQLCASVQSTAFRRVLGERENLVGQEKSPAEAGTLNARALTQQLPVGQLSGLQEDEEKFSVVMVLEQSDERIKVASVEWKKVSFDEWWSGAKGGLSLEVAAPSFGYQALEIGAAAGACGSDAWMATSTTGAPSARTFHSAVWTGSEMIVWGGATTYPGGTAFSTGGRYIPATDSWTATTINGAPSARSFHSAVWTGTEIIIWGGLANDGSTVNTGGRYNPATDSWRATTINGAPGVRFDHVAVWTGSEMIVWGGYFPPNTGGRYNPTTDSWTATSTVGAPSQRGDLTAIWTGSEMIVWGGYGGNWLNTGGRYNPTTDSWIATTTAGAPSGRDNQSAVWTGTEMIVWGGLVTGDIPINTGGRYNPATNSWKATNIDSAPNARAPRYSAIWTGNEMITWGGAGSNNTGGRYNPIADSWIATTTTGAPGGRHADTAVWTGSEMIVWGGTTGNGGSSFNTGGRYSFASPLTLSPATQSFSAAGGTGSIIITAQGGCTWTATSNANFITITSGSSGAGNGTVNFSVAANTTSSARTGTLTIGGQTFTVTQAAASRTVRVVATNAVAGSTANVPIELDALGNENGVSFSLNFDPAVLSNPQAALGSGATGATLTTNPNQIAQGRLGIVLTQQPGQAFTAGTKQILVVTFTVSSTTTASTTTISFGDQPTAREVVDPNANTLPTTFTPGVVTITAPCPTVTSINPTSGGNSSQVVITGANLTGVTAVKFAGNAAATFTVNSNTQITATVPSNAITGPLTITKPGCADVTTPPFTITSSISGTINYGTVTKPVPGVTLTATGAPAATSTTNSAGNYTLAGLGNGPYTVTPSKTGEVNGISSLDAAMVAQFAVGLITLSPNQLIAADASGNGVVTSFDAALIAQTAAGLPNSGIAGTWKFAPANRSYPTLNGNQTNQNFDAILVGDVSGNWTSPAATSPRERPVAASSRAVIRSGSDFPSRATSTQVSLQAASGAIGEIVTIPMTVDETHGQQVIAYDFTLSFDPRVLQLSSTPFETDDTLSAGWKIVVNNATPGQLRLSAFGISPLSSAGTLLKLKFKVMGARGTQSALTWQSLSFNEGQLRLRPVNGHFKVNSARAATQARSHRDQ